MTPAHPRETSWARRPRWDLLVPCILLAAFASPLVSFRIPANFDTIDESFEPIKTLKFVHSKGRAIHKWGPMPSFIYAPVYAPPLAYWYLTGGLGKLSDDYPYGFTRPHEQEGVLIMLARLAGLSVALAGTAYLGWSLARVTGSRTAAFLAILFCVATSPELAIRFVSTKPDGLMLGFLGAATGVYALIVSEGLTRGRGAALSLLAVFSISCKELTAPAFVLPYAGLAVAGWLRSRGNPAARRRFLADFAVALAVGVVSYLIINVAYAPSTWLERMRLWVAGPGKDPAVWARPGYTRAEYVRDVGVGLLRNFDAGGLAVLGLAAVASVFAPVRHRLLLWLPTASFLGVLVATAGYMPSYFLLPVNMTAVPAVAAALAYLGGLQLPRPARTTGIAVLTALAAFNVWGGSAAWPIVQTEFSWAHERYCLKSLSKNELIFTGNLHQRQPGADRLSYLGFNVDDRALGEIMARPPRMPDVVLVERAQVNWMDDFAKRPARNRMMKDVTNYSYDQFEGFESLGYRLAEVVHSPLPWPADERFFPWYAVPPYSDLMVYRRDAGARTPSTAGRREADQ